MSSSCSDNRLIMGPTSNRINMELLKCIIKENSSGEIICATAPLMKMDKITEIEGDTNAKILSIKDNSITSNFLATAAVNNSKIAEGAIRPSKLAKPINADGMTSSNNKILLYNGTSWEYAPVSACETGISAVKTPTGSGLKALTNSENQDVEMCVVDDGITELKLADGAVTTSKIADKNVTTEKLDDNLITLDKLANGDTNKTQILVWDDSAGGEKWELADYNPPVQGVNSVNTAGSESGLTITDPIGDVHIKISDMGVTSSMIKDGNVLPTKLKPGTTGKKEILLWGYGGVDQWNNVDTEMNIVTSVAAKTDYGSNNISGLTIFPTSGDIKINIETEGVVSNMIKSEAVTPDKLEGGTNNDQILLWTDSGGNGNRSWERVNYTQSITSITGSSPIVVDNTTPESPLIKLIQGQSDKQLLLWDASGQQWQLGDTSELPITAITSISTTGPIENNGTPSVPLIELEKGTIDNQILLWDNTDLTWTVADSSSIPSSGVTSVNPDGGASGLSVTDSTSDAKIKISDEGILNTMISDAAVTETKIANNAVTNSRIADAAVTADKIAESVIGTSKIIDNSITSDKLGIAAVNPDNISINAVTSDKISNEAITTTKLELGTESQTELLIWNGSEWEITQQGITGSMLVDSTITSTQIANNSVGAHEITDGSITPVKFAPPSHAVANKPWPAMFLYINDFNPRWVTKYLRFFWNPVGGLLEEIEIDPDTGEALTGSEIQANLITIKHFENVAGSNDTSLSVKGYNPSKSVDDQDNKTALFIESGTSTMESNTIQSTLNLKNNMTDSSEDCNKTAVLNIYDNAIRVADAKYFFPVVDKCTKGGVDSLIGKSLVVKSVQYDKESDDTSIIDDYIPNIYFGYSP